MANDRRDKSGLVHQFEKLKQQVSISLTPTAIAPLDTVGRIFGMKGTAVTDSGVNFLRAAEH